MSTKRNIVVIGIGSNIQPEIFIPKALNLLAENLFIIKKSSFIQTSPIGHVAQPDFINGAVLIETARTIKQLKILLKQIEDKLGRIRTIDKFGPRNIDLDLLLYNFKILAPEVNNRDFLQKSIKELLPNYSFSE